MVQHAGFYGKRSRYFRDRNLLIGPGVANVDFSVVKIFPIHKGPFAETQALQFRAEFFNVQPISIIRTPR